MVGNTTVNATETKDVPLKSTGDEKVRASVCLTAKTDGTKMKSFAVCQTAKRETAVLNDDLKHCCVVASFCNFLDKWRACFTVFKKRFLFLSKKYFVLIHFRSSHDQTSKKVIEGNENCWCPYSRWIIHCFKSESPCLEGASLLKDQVNILNNYDIVNCNPFEVTDSDVDEANIETNIIDECDHENHFIDIE